MLDRKQNLLPSKQNLLHTEKLENEWILAKLKTYRCILFAKYTDTNLCKKAVRTVRSVLLHKNLKILPADTPGLLMCRAWRESVYLHQVQIFLSLCPPIAKQKKGWTNPPFFLPGSKSTPCCNWMLTQKHLLPRRKNFFYQFDKVDDKLIYKVQTGAKHCNSTKQARRNKNIQKSMFLE